MKIESMNVISSTYFSCPGTPIGFVAMTEQNVIMALIFSSGKGYRVAGTVNTNCIVYYYI